jgi:hypothetical protein
MNSVHYLTSCPLRFTLMFLEALASSRESTLSCVMSNQSVRLSAYIRTAPTGRISLKFDTGGLVWKSVEMMKIWLKSDKNRTSCTKSYVGYVLLFLATLNHHKAPSSSEVLSGSWDSQGYKNMRTRQCYATRTLLPVFLSTPRNPKRSVSFTSSTKFLYLLFISTFLPHASLQHP